MHLNGLCRFSRGVIYDPTETIPQTAPSLVNFEGLYTDNYIKDMGIMVTDRNLTAAYYSSDNINRCKDMLEIELFAKMAVPIYVYIPYR